MSETRRSESLWKIHLTSKELSDRWNVPTKTLSQWRWNGKGPEYLKLGKHISYRLEDIEIFEKSKLRRDTVLPPYKWSRRNLVNRG